MEFSYKTTIEVEVPVTITFSVCPGEGDGWNEPRIDAYVEDASITIDPGFKLTRQEEAQILDDLDSDLMDHAEEHAAGERAAAAEFRYDCMKDDGLL